MCLTGELYEVKFFGIAFKMFESHLYQVISESVSGTSQIWLYPYLKFTRCSHFLRRKLRYLGVVAKLFTILASEIMLPKDVVNSHVSCFCTTVSQVHAFADTSLSA